MRKILPVILVSATLCTICPAQNVEPKAYSVCQAIDQAWALNGRTVVIRGFFGGTEFHGHFISQSTNDDPCPGWRAKYLTSPSAIVLGSYGSTASRQAVARVLSPCLDIYRVQGFKRYSAEVLGVFRRKRLFPLVFRRSDGSYVGWYSTGFGEGAGYPFMLVATAAKCAM